MKKSSWVLIVSSLLFATGFYACENDVRWLSPEDSPERCKDGIDNDDNGKIDCQDEQCKQFDHCKSPVNPVPENTEDLCNDGIDNDSNQKTDCQEESCKQFDNCQPPEDPVPEDSEDLCKDGIDNDNNNKIDCEEDSCKEYTYCIETQPEPNTEPENTLELCTDGFDNDKNGRKDCQDESCKEFEACKDENGNHLKDEFEPGFESAEKCNKHSKCASGFCDSFIGKCSVKCTSDEQCLSGFICRQDGRCSSDTFESVWTFPHPFAKLVFTDYTITDGECDFEISWGDGTAKEKWTSCPTAERPLIHVFVKAGSYHVRVTGTMTRWRPMRANSSLDLESTLGLESIISYGRVGLAANAFDCGGTASAWEVCGLFGFKTFGEDIDIPDPTYLGIRDDGERTLERMFYRVSTFKTGVSKWDISNITSLKETFICDHAFSEPDLTRWDTSNVTDMSSTFKACAITGHNSFNGNMSTWDTSKVTTMNSMLYMSSYRNNNGTIANWDVSNVTDFTNIFSGAYIGTYCDQLKKIAEAWNRPEVITDYCKEQ